MRLSVALVCAAATFVASIEAAPPGYSESADLQATWEAEHGGAAPEYDFDEEDSAMLMARGVNHGQNMPKGGHKHHMARDAQATKVDGLDEPAKATPGNLGIPRPTDLTQALKDLYDRFVGGDEDETAAKMMRRDTDDDLYTYDDEDDLADTTGKDTTEAQREAMGPEVEEEIDPALLEDRDLGEMEGLERRSLEADIAFGQSDDGEEFDGSDHAEHEKRGLDATEAEMSAYAELDMEGEMGEFSDPEHAEHEKRGLDATPEEMSAYADLDPEMNEYLPASDHVEHEKRGLDATPEEMSAYADLAEEGDMGEFTPQEHAEHEKRGLDATEAEMIAYADLDVGDLDDGTTALSDEEKEHFKRGLGRDYDGVAATEEEMEAMGEVEEDETSEIYRREAEADANESKPQWKWGSWKSLQTRSEREGEGFPDEEAFFEPADGAMGAFTDPEHAEHEKRGIEATAEEMSKYADLGDMDDEPLPGEDKEGDMGEFTDSEHAEHEKRGLDATADEMSAYADLEDFGVDDEALPGEETDGDMGGFAPSEHAEHEKRGLDATADEMSAYADLDDEALPGEEVDGDMGEFSQEEHEEHEKRGLEDDLTFDTDDDEGLDPEESLTEAEIAALMAKEDAATTKPLAARGDDDPTFGTDDDDDDDLEPEESLTEAEIAALMAKEDAAGTKPLTARGVPSGFTHLPSNARPAYPTGSGAPSLPPYTPTTTAHKTPSPTPWFKFPW